MFKNPNFSYRFSEQQPNQSVKNERFTFEPQQKLSNSLKRNTQNNNQTNNEPRCTFEPYSQNLNNNASERFSTNYQQQMQQQYKNSNVPTQSVVKANDYLNQLEYEPTESKTVDNTQQWTQQQSQQQTQYSIKQHQMILEDMSILTDSNIDETMQEKSIIEKFHNPLDFSKPLTYVEQYEKQQQELQQQQQNQQYKLSEKMSQQKQQQVIYDKQNENNNQQIRYSNNEQQKQYQQQQYQQTQQFQQENYQSDQKEIDNMYNDMSVIKEDVIDLLQNYKKQFTQSNSKKIVKQKIQEDSEQIYKNFNNVVQKYQQNFADISVMSKTDNSVMTNVSQLGNSILKGNSKKEQEISMMVNLVEEFLVKFGQQPKSNISRFEDSNIKSKSGSIINNFNDNEQLQISSPKQQVIQQNNEQNLFKKQNQQETNFPKFQENKEFQSQNQVNSDQKKYYESKVTYQPYEQQENYENKQEQYRASNANKQIEQQYQYNDNKDEPFFNYQDNPSQRISKIRTQKDYEEQNNYKQQQNIESEEEKQEKLRKIYEQQQQQKKLQEKKNLEQQNIYQDRQQLQQTEYIEKQKQTQNQNQKEQVRESIQDGKRIVYKTISKEEFEQKKCQKEYQFGDNTINNQYEQIKQANYQLKNDIYYCPRCDQEFDKCSEFLSHIEPCNQQNQLLLQNDASIFVTDNYQTLMEKIDKKIVKIQKNIKTNLNSKTHTMTGEILQTTLQDLNLILKDTENQELVKKIIKKLENMTTSLDTNKYLQLHKYITRIINLLQEKSNAIEQNSILLDISKLNQTEISQILPKKIKEPYYPVQYEQQQTQNETQKHAHQQRDELQSNKDKQIFYQGQNINNVNQINMQDHDEEKYANRKTADFNPLQYSEKHFQTITNQNQKQQENNSQIPFRNTTNDPRHIYKLQQNQNNQQQKPQIQRNTHNINTQYQIQKQQQQQELYKNQQEHQQYYEQQQSQKDHYKPQIAQIEINQNKNQERQSVTQKKALFYKLATESKKQLPQNSEFKVILISDLYEEALKLQISENQFQSFINSKFQIKN